MEMLKEIQEKLLEKHGGDWPKYAILRYAELENMKDGLGYNREIFQEYQLLSEWLINTVEAGIATHQKAW